MTGDLALAWADGKNRSKHTPITNLSPFSGHIGLNYDKDGRWGMGTRWRFAMKKADKDIDNEGVRSPLKGSGGYGIWDITGYYRPTKGLTARAGAFNILDKKYITWGEAKGLADDISRERYSAPGRWFGASLRYDF
ncbi:MAG: TonB-dependent receptor domain-containing protein [Cardiobacterium hominis]|uniref:TonB-dependent receptor domain-containing protein n=1 Tax=Cardiobacterium hominis TaxID=2718 RepID=UPI002117AD05|nr:TonB-dependent receptor [Cardiobacterium hominis]